MSKLLEGKKTYLSLVVILLGVFGLGDMISEGELADGVDLVLQLVGLVGAVYGRFKAKSKVVVE